MRSAAPVAYSAPENIPPLNIKKDAASAASTCPRELTACESVSRKCERDGGLNNAASGLAATCNCVTPAAMTKSAASTAPTAASAAST